MSIQSSITQPLSLMGLLATQAPIVKKGEAIANAEKKHKLANEAYEQSLDSLERPFAKYDSSEEVEARIRVASSAAAAKTEAASELRRLKPTEKNVRQEALDAADEIYAEELGEAQREAFDRELDKRIEKREQEAERSEAAMRKKADEHLAEKRNTMLETMRRTNPAGVAAYEAVYGKGGKR